MIRTRNGYEENVDQMSKNVSTKIEKEIWIISNRKIESFRSKSEEFHICSMHE